jgi:hypothetical protein
MTDLRAQIEQLPRYGNDEFVTSNPHVMAEMPKGKWLKRSQVLRLLADHAAPVVAPSGKRYDLAYSIARRIVGSTSGTQTIDAIAESLILFPDESPTVQLLAAPVVGETPREPEEP